MATEIIGNEYDENLQSDLEKLLKQMGAVLIKEECGHGGSQDIESYEYELDGKRLVVECETYIGLSITGEDTLISEIKRQVTDGGQRDQNAIP